MANPQNTDPVETHVVSYCARRAGALHDMIYEARERGFTPEEQASLAGLAEALRELLGDEELEPAVDQPAALSG